MNDENRNQDCDSSRDKLYSCYSLLAIIGIFVGIFGLMRVLPRMIMKNASAVLLLALAITVMPFSVVGAKSLPTGLPSSVVPNGIGVNITYSVAMGSSRDRDLDMIQAAGIKFIRLDLFWGLVENSGTGKGNYDFAAYDGLTEALAKRGIRALYILDYSNPLYTGINNDKYAPITPEVRQAFANFASAAAWRYRGQGIIWELWNEPNIEQFWKPQPSVDDYMALANLVLPAVRAADSSAVIVAPAISTITSDRDFQFLRTCFDKGLLNLVDAVSVHPYRNELPETVAADIEKLRNLIDGYRPGVPIVSSEWGYGVPSEDWPVANRDLQGSYSARIFLTNLSLGIPLSVWFDWRAGSQNDDDSSAIVNYDYEPYPAYRKIQKLVGALSGMHFVKRLASDSKDYLLLFSQTNNGRGTIVAWTTSDPHEVEPVHGVKIFLNSEPQYISDTPSALVIPIIEPLILNK